MSSALVEHGVDMKVAIKAPIMATPDMLHKNVTHKLIKQMYNKTSTTELTTVEMSKVTETITNIFSERTQGEVFIPFAEKSQTDYAEYIRVQKVLKDF
jgi:hypothetical protein